MLPASYTAGVQNPSLGVIVVLMRGKVYWRFSVPPKLKVIEEVHGNNVKMLPTFLAPTRVSSIFQSSVGMPK